MAVTWQLQQHRQEAAPKCDRSHSLTLDTLSLKVLGFEPSPAASIGPDSDDLV